MTRPGLSVRSLEEFLDGFRKVGTCTFVPDSPAMYLGNDEGGKIRLRPKLNNPYPMLGGGTITVKIFGVGLLTLLNSSGIAGIYPRPGLGNSGLCRSQIRGLRMSHRLFLGCTRGPPPLVRWLIKRA